MKPLFLAAYLILGTVIPLLHAQQAFDSNLRPTLTYTETYAETLTFADSQYNNPGASAIVISGSKYSLIGMEPVDEFTAISITFGDFSFSGYLSDAPDFKPGLATIPITKIDAADNVVNIGSVKVTWSTSGTTPAMSFKVTLLSPANTEKFAIAQWYATSDGAIDQSSTLCTIGFGVDAMESSLERMVYYSGTASQKDSANSPSGSLATVILSGGFDSTPPVVSVGTPVPNGKVYYSDIGVDGSVSDSLSGPQTVSVQINDAPSIEIDVQGADDWSLSPSDPVLLKEGVNNIKVTATDMDGNVSTITSSCTYLKASPLVVTTGSGSGTTTLSGTTTQRTGGIVSISAIPADGYKFDHWEGSLGKPGSDAYPINLTDTQKEQVSLSFTMQPSAYLKAFFKPNAFLGLSGNYNGILTSGTQPNADGGKFSLKLGNSGAFTGKLTIGGIAYTLKGEFNDKTGIVFSGTFGKYHELLLELNIDAQSGDKKIRGTATVGGLVANIESDLAVWNAISNPFTSGTGAYTFLLPAAAEDEGDTTIPQGTGYGTATISAAGVVKLKGVLGDGTKFSTSTTASKNLSFPLFIPLYSKQGALSGEVTLRPVTGVSDFNGLLSWYKPITTGVFYPAGFSLTPQLIGARYVQTVPLEFNGGDAYLSILTSSSNSALISSTTSAISVSLNKYQAALLPGLVPNPNKLAFTVTPSTGLFSGGFYNGSKTSFKGAVFQKQSLGGGIFKNATQSGSVLIEPNGNLSSLISTGTSR